MFVTIMFVMSPQRPRSRRDRPAKPPLSREWIVDTALQILRTDGMAKVTVRRVAQQLDTGPASLYVYIANTAELHSALLDRLLADLPRTEDGDWSASVVQTLMDYSALLTTYPGLARSAMTIRPTGPNILRLVDHLLDLMITGGVPADRAAWGADLLILIATADAAEHGPSDGSDPNASSDDEDEWQTVIEAARNADAETLPRLAEHSDLIISGEPDERQRWALRATLAGIAATPTNASGEE